MATVNDPTDYYFPDMENISLIDNRPREASSTHLPGLIAAGALALGCAASLIIGWILFARDHSAFLLGFSITASVAFLASLFLAFTIFQASRASRQSPANQGSSNLELLGFMVGVCLAAFFLVSAAGMLLYRPLHYNAMAAAVVDKDLWESRWGGVFEDRWTEGRRLLLALGLLCLGCFAASAIAAMSLYSNYKDKSVLNVTLLYFSLLVAFVFALASINEYLTLSLFDNDPENHVYHKLLVTLFVFAIVALSLLLLNGIAGLFKLKIALFLFGFLLVILALSGVFIIGSFSRQARKTLSADGFELGRTVLSRTHEDDALAFCASKYVASNKGCRKADSAVHWEAGSGETLPLNIDCYYPAANWLGHSYLRCIIFLLLAIIFAYLAAFADFAIAKDRVDHPRTFVLFVFLGLMLLALLAFILVFVFFPRLFSSFAAWDRANELGQTNFRPVPQRLLTHALEKPGCASLGDVGLFELSKPGFYRLALLGQGLVFDNTANLPQGSPNSRTIFFDDWNSRNPYILLLGTKETLQAAFDELLVCPQDPSNTRRIYLHAEWLEKPELLDAQGLKAGELLTNSEALTPNGKNYADSLAYSRTLNCDPVCRVLFDFERPENKVTIAGHLLVRNSAGALEYYGVPEAEETLSVYFGSNQSSPVSYKNNGQFDFTTFAYPTLKRTATLRLKDKNGYYIENFVDFEIPPREQIGDTFDVGAIQLLTSNGQGCKGETDVRACYSAAKLLYGKLTVTVRNALTRELESVEVELRRSHSLTGDVLTTFTPSGENYSLGDFAYGTYLIRPLDARFFKLEQKISLQADSLAVQLILVPLPPEGVHRFYAKIPSSQIDYDLNLELENENGSKCFVNSQNKYCGFARHMQDVKRGEEGYEVIDVQKFAVANYMLFLGPAPAYAGTCPAFEAYQALGKQPVRALSFDDGRSGSAGHLAETPQIVAGSQGLTSENVQFSVFNSDLPTANSDAALGQNIFGLLTELPADQIYTINTGSKPVLESLVLSISNKFKNDEAKQLQYMKNIQTSSKKDADLVLTILKSTNPALAAKTETYYKSTMQNYKFESQPIDLSAYKVQTQTQALSESETTVMVAGQKESNTVTPAEQKNTETTSTTNTTIESKIIPIAENQSSTSTTTESNITPVAENQPSTSITNSIVTSEQTELQTTGTTPTETQSEVVPSTSPTEQPTSEFTTVLVETPSIKPTPIVAAESTPEDPCDTLQTEFIASLKTDLNLSSDQTDNIAENLRLNNISPSLGYDDNAMTAALSTTDRPTRNIVRIKWASLLKSALAYKCKALATQTTKLLTYADALNEITASEGEISTGTGSTGQLGPSTIIVPPVTVDICDQLARDASDDLLSFDSLKGLEALNSDDQGPARIAKIKAELTSSIKNASVAETEQILHRVSFFEQQARLNGCEDLDTQLRAIEALISTALPAPTKEELCKNLRLKVSKTLPLMELEIRTSGQTISKTAVVTNSVPQNATELIPIGEQESTDEQNESESTTQTEQQQTIVEQPTTEESSSEVFNNAPAGVSVESQPNQIEEQTTTTTTNSTITKPSSQQTETSVTSETPEPTDLNKEKIQSQIQTTVEAQADARLFRCANLHDKLQTYLQQLDFKVREKTLSPCEFALVQLTRQFKENGFGPIVEHSAAQTDAAIKLETLLASLNADERSRLLILAQQQQQAKDNQSCSDIQLRLSRVVGAIQKQEQDIPTEVVDQCLQKLGELNQALYAKSLSKTDKAEDVNTVEVEGSFKAGLASKSDENLVALETQLADLQTSNANCLLNSTLLNNLLSLIDAERRGRADRAKAQSIVAPFGISEQVFENKGEVKATSGNTELTETISGLSNEQQEQLKTELQQQIISNDQTCHSIRARASGITSLIDFQAKYAEKPASQPTVITTVTSVETNKIEPSSIVQANSAVPTETDYACSGLQANVTTVLKSHGLSEDVLSNEDPDKEVVLLSDIKVNASYLSSEELQTLSGWLTNEYQATSETCAILRTKIASILEVLHSEASLVETKETGVSVASVPITADDECKNVESRLRQQITDMGLNPNDFVSTNADEPLDPKSLDHQLASLSPEQQAKLTTILEQAKTDSDSCAGTKTTAVFLLAVLGLQAQKSQVTQTPIVGVCEVYAQAINKQVADQGIPTTTPLFGENGDVDSQQIAALSKDEVEKLQAILALNEAKFERDCPKLSSQVDGYKRQVALWFDARNQALELACHDLRKRAQPIPGLLDFVIRERSGDIVLQSSVVGVTNVQSKTNLPSETATAELNPSNSTIVNQESSASEEVESVPSETTEIEQNEQPSAVVTTEQPSEVVSVQLPQTIVQPSGVQVQSQVSQCSALRDKLSQAPGLLSVKIREGPVVVSQCTEQLNDLKSQLGQNGFDAALLQTSFADKTQNDLELHAIIYGLTDDQRAKLAEILSKAPNVSLKCGSLGQRIQDIQGVLGQYRAGLANKAGICDASQKELDEALQGVKLESEDIAGLRQPDTPAFDLAIERLLSLLGGLDEAELAQFQARLDSLDQKMDGTACLALSIEIARIKSLEIFYHSTTQPIGQVQASEPTTDTITINSEVNGENLNLEEQVLANSKPVGVESAIIPIQPDNTKCASVKDKLASFFEAANIKAVVLESPRSQKCIFCKPQGVQVQSGAELPPDTPTVTTSSEDSGAPVTEETTVTTVEAPEEQTVNVEAGSNEQSQIEEPTQTQTSAIVAPNTPPQPTCSLDIDKDYNIDCANRPNQDFCLSLKSELQRFKAELAAKNYSTDDCEKIREKLKDVLASFNHNTYCFRAQDKLLKFINLYFDKVNQLNDVSAEEIDAINRPIQPATIVSEAVQPTTVEPTPSTVSEATEPQTEQEQTGVPAVPENSSIEASEAQPITEEQPTTSALVETTPETESQGTPTEVTSESESPSATDSAPIATSDSPSGQEQGGDKTDEEAPIVEARRLEAVSATFNPQDQKFILVNCFTGFGKRSFKTLHVLLSSRPNIDLCKKMFENSKYSIDSLVKQISPSDD